MSREIADGRLDYSSGQIDGKRLKMADQQQSLGLGGTGIGPIELVLPWPPSLNHYFQEYAMPPAGDKVKARIEEHGYDGLHVWLRKNTRVMKRVSEKGQEYRADVLEYILTRRLNKGFREPLIGEFHFYPPDRRERDMDNHYKALFDALEHAAFYRRDSQVKVHRSQFYDHEPVKDGKVVVTFEELLY